jgi:hypothetical protein
MAMVDADWTIDRSTKNIRYVGGDHDNSPTYATVIEFHRWLQDFADQEVSSGDDELDITDLTPSERSTDNIITMKNGYNIDDNAAEHLYDGSIIQGTGGTEEYYDGIVNFGNASVQIQIIQNGAVLSDDWWNQGGAGINASAQAGISHRFMIKTRTSGADINGRRLIGMARTYLYTYSEFSINGTSRGNNVLALTDALDLNNETAIATVAGYTGITNTTEGYNGIDVDGNGADEYYYSEWNTNQPTRSINDFYERMKWLSKSPVAEDSATETGTDYVVGNGTLTGQAQSFANGANDTLLTKAVFKLKKTLLPTGNATAVLYAHTGTFGSSSTPTGAALATSDNFDVSTLDGTYRDVVFNFSGANLVSLTASTNYCIAVEYTGGDASNYIQVRGDSTGSHAGNQSDETASVWTAAAAEDLHFEVYTSPAISGLPGVLFRGITHEIDVDGATGTMAAVEEVTWSGGSGQLLAINSPTAATKIWIQLLTGVIPTDDQVITGTGTVTAELTTGVITPRTLSTPFVGVSTGTAIIGSYGLGIEAADLNAIDKVFDLTNTQITPPNNVTFTVLGLISGQDRVLVTNDQATGIDFDQMTLATGLSATNETNVNVQAASIPDDTPSPSGNLRIELDDGRYKLVPYTAIPDTSNFTIGSTDFSGAGNGASISNNVFLAYIDKLATGTSEAFTTVYDTDRTLFVRVRDGGVSPIKTFETTGTLGTNGGNSTAIRTPDE